MMKESGGSWEAEALVRCAPFCFPGLHVSDPGTK